MRSLLTTRLLSVLIFCAIFMAQLPTDATAQWKRRKENLPGLVSTKTLILVGAGTAGAIFLLTKLSKSGKESKAKAQESMSSSISAPSSSTLNSYAHSSHPGMASEPRVALIVDVNDYGIEGFDSLERRMNFKNKTVSLGLSVGF